MAAIPMNLGQEFEHKVYELLKIEHTRSQLSSIRTKRKFSGIEMTSTATLEPMFYLT